MHKLDKFMQEDKYKDIVGSGRIIMPTRQSYLDQIDGLTVVSSKRIKSYLYDKYGLTEEQYYNLIVYGDINNFPKCNNKNCHNNRKFIRLSVGYQKYCCNKCKNDSVLPDIVNKIPWTDDRRLAKSELNRVIQINKVNSGSHNFINQSDSHKFNAQIESAKFTFISRAKKRNKTVGMLYYGLIDDKNFKIGITFVSIESRSAGLRTIHLLIKDSIENVADIEYNIKKKFRDYSTYTKESFKIEKFRDILNEIKTYYKLPA